MTSNHKFFLQVEPITKTLLAPHGMQLAFTKFKYLFLKGDHGIRSEIIEVIRPLVEMGMRIKQTIYIGLLAHLQATFLTSFSTSYSGGVARTTTEGVNSSSISMLTTQILWL